MSQVPPLSETLARMRAEVHLARPGAALREAREWALRQPGAAQPPEGFPADWPMQVDLAELLRWHDADFIAACYHALLRRPPDPDGFAIHLEVLRAGRGRANLALDMHLSDEGRRAGATLTGAAAARIVRKTARIPVVGALAAVAAAVASLPRQVREREEEEARLLAKLAQCETDLRLLRLEIAYLNERLSRGVSAGLEQSFEAMEALSALRSELRGLRSDIAALRHAER